jgi:hypothetical protein
MLLGKFVQAKKPGGCGLGFQDLSAFNKAMLTSYLVSELVGCQGH